MPYPCLLHPETLPLQQSTAHWYFHRKYPTHSSGSVSVGSLGPSVHKVCSSHLSISGGEGVLILNVILPLLPSCWGISFALGHEVSFFSRIQHFPVDGCSAMSCNFGILIGEGECMSFYSAILDKRPLVVFVSQEQDRLTTSLFSSKCRTEVAHSSLPSLSICAMMV